MREIKRTLNNDDMETLLKFCTAYPRIYNKMSNLLYKEFGVISAELSLLITWAQMQVIDVEVQDGTN